MLEAYESQATIQHNGSNRLQTEQYTTTIVSHTGKQDIGISFFRKRNVFNRPIACSTQILTLAILEVSDTSPDDIARFPQVHGGIAHLACTTIKSSLTLNPSSAITWSFGSNRDTTAQLLKINLSDALPPQHSDTSENIPFGVIATRNFRVQ